mgnify:FL=1
MYARNTLETLKAKALQDICISYNLKKSGKKGDLIERIINHQEKIQKEEEAKKQLLEYGAEPRSVEFENIIRAFDQWCSKEGFAPYQGYMTTKKVDINEIRSEFANHPHNLDSFLYMLFNVREDWEFYDTTNQDREFDCDSEYNPDWLVDGVTEIYNTL